VAVAVAAAGLPPVVVVVVAAVAVVGTSAETAVRARKLELVALDLDGTLVDSAPDIAHCLGTAVEAVGFARPTEAQTRVWIGDGLETLIGRALKFAARAAGVAEDAKRHPIALDAFLACYRDNLFVRTTLYPHAVATLDTLRARGLRLCCITNKRFDFAAGLLTQASVRDRFELLLGGDSLPEKKPSPLQLNVAAETLGVTHAAATLVGDSHQDLHAAHSAGFGFVHAGYGYGKVTETELGTAPRIRAIAELTNVLGLA
jgi:phosphoglycolate phosphatase